MSQEKLKKLTPSSRAAVLSAINKVFREALTCETIEDVGRACLDAASELTGSAIGFIGEVNESGLFDDIALNNPAWDACKMPESKRAKLIHNMEIRSYWGSVITSGKSRIVNNPSSAPDRRGLPDGHPPIKCFLGVPLKAGDATVGMIALANKPRGYDEADMEKVEALSSAFVVALQRKSATDSLSKAHAELEVRVKERTAELMRLNEDLEKEISERKAAEVSLEAQKQRFYDVLETLPAYVVLLDEDYRVPFANKFFRTRFGDSGGRRCYDYLFNRKEPCEICETYKVLKTGKPREWEWTGPDERDYYIYDFPFKEADGSTLILEMGIDVTEQKQAEEKLRESERRLKEAEELALLGHWELDLTANTLHWSDETYRIFGMDPSKFGASYEAFLGAVHPEDREFVNKAYTESVKNRTDYDVVHRLVMKDGSVKFVNERCRTYYAPDGTPVRSLGTVSDITRRVMDEEARLKLEADLRQTQKLEAVGRLAGGVAHDFNNRLAAIISYAHVLKMKLGHDDERAQIADRIISTSEKAAGLTRSLLSFGRKEPIALKPVDLRKTMESALYLIRRVLMEDIEVVSDSPEGEVVVMADEGQIENMLINLAANAGDAMPGGGTLGVRNEVLDLDDASAALHGLQKAGSYARITVSDNGSGMDKETASRIFEPFFTTKEKGRGTGLGLPIVYGIVKQHGGHISVYSEPGVGTTFKIYLPAAAGTVKADDSSKLPPPGGTETILLAEDDPDVRRGTRDVLEAFGYKVIEAEDGREAVRKYEEYKGKIDLLMLDVVMRGMNGLEALKAIRKISQGVKAVFMSGYAQDVLGGSGVGTADVVVKPVMPNVLLQKVREILDRG